MNLPLARRKIFVTVGAQMPFDRLVRAVDHWAAGRGDMDIFAQTGEGGYVPTSFPSTSLCSPTEFRERLAWADLLVAHAGMGSILQALQFGKPILVMPRKGDLRETRNDHQVATAQWLSSQRGITVAWDERETIRILDDISTIQTGGGVPEFASRELIERLRRFIDA